MSFYCTCQREDRNRKWFLLLVRLFATCSHPSSNGAPASCGRSLAFFKLGKVESVRDYCLSWWIFWSVAAEGRGGGRGAELLSPFHTWSAVCLGSKCSTVSRCSQSTTCEDDAHSPGGYWGGGGGTGACYTFTRHGSHRGAGTEHTHVHTRHRDTL